MNPATRLRDLGFSIDDPPSPSGPCIPVSAAAGLLYVAGQLPLRDGALLAEGLVGREVTVEAARQCARQAAANALAQLNAAVGTLTDARLVRLTCYVAAAADFGRHSEVADAASELVMDILGERGAHSRTAVGVACLPRRSPVELDVIAVLADERRGPLS